MSEPIFRRTSLYRRFNGVPEMVVGRVQGPWVVVAELCEHCGDVKPIIFSSAWSSSGTNIGDHSIARAGDDWRPLLLEVLSEAQRQTGRSISMSCTEVWGFDDKARLAIAKEAIDLAYSHQTARTQ